MNTSPSVGVKPREKVVSTPVSRYAEARVGITEVETSSATTFTPPFHTANATPSASLDAPIAVPLAEGVAANKAEAELVAFETRKFPALPEPPACSAKNASPDVPVCLALMAAPVPEVLACNAGYVFAVFTISKNTRISIRRAIASGVNRCET